MAAALCVFVYSAYQLATIYLTYKEGSDEYSDLARQFVSGPEEGEDASGGAAGGEDSPDANHAPGGRETRSAEDASGGDGSPDAGDASDGDGSQGTKEASDSGGSRDTAGKDKAEEPATEGFTEEKGEKGEQIILPVMKNPIDFEGLQEINEEIIAWLRVPGIDISYPVAQGEDNDYYLHHTFERTENIAGCLFLSCTNAPGFTDQNSVIYGHNMKNASMFGKLNYFGYEDAYEKSHYFWIYTPDYIYRCRIFSCSVVDSKGDAYQEKFTEEEFTEFIEKMREKSMIDADEVEILPEDKVVTLSTCTGDDATRFILQGKLEKTYRSMQKKEGEQK